ncbi:MAG: hypothetical protein HY067_08055 [Betaproteobacteria bacterium]|nr:hypothetical protein [Betaproteobacteria bacterium]
MPLLNNYLVDQLLVPVVFLFFLVSGIFGVGMGIGLIVFRVRVFRLFGPMNRWVSARKKLEPMEARHEIEPFVYKYRRWFGALFIIGGTFSIVMLVVKVDAAAVASVFGARRFSVIGHWGIQSLATLLIVGSVLAIAIGIILGFFPRALGALEMRANRWYSSRQIAKGADKMHVPLDRWFESSPRTAGWILAVAALILSINSAIVLLGHR